MATVWNPYGTSKELETRVKYFATRFHHDVRCQGAADELGHAASLILELGCGTMRPLLPIGSDYGETQKVWGVDSSVALLRRARENAPDAERCCGNAESLPFGDGVFDLVWARHMLYCVEHPSRALNEVRRCLRSDGVFCLSTNSEANKPEMHEFHKLVLKACGIQIGVSERLSDRFPAERAAAVTGGFFRYVIDCPYRGSFHFASPAEFLEYYVSTVFFRKTELLGASRELLIETAASLLAETPVLTVSNHGTIVFATNRAARYDELTRRLP